MQHWTDHPGMKNIDPVKLELIKMTLDKSNGKRGNSLASVLLALIASAKRQNIQFTPNEVSLIIEIMKEGKSEEEIAQIDQTIQLTKTFLKRNKE